MLKEALKAAIPTQPELAKAAGITYHALRQYRKGLRTPSPEVIRRIARAIRQHGGKLQQLADALEAASQERNKKPRR
jgi:transcriptional regulator with XRE-family HTH domain